MLTQARLVSYVSTAVSSIVSFVRIIAQDTRARLVSYAYWSVSLVALILLRNMS